MVWKRRYFGVKWLVLITDRHNFERNRGLACKFCTKLRSHVDIPFMAQDRFLVVGGIINEFLFFMLNRERQGLLMSPDREDGLAKDLMMVIQTVEILLFRKPKKSYDAGI